jgi:DNA-binding NtrC family response regulator
MAKIIIADDDPSMVSVLVEVLKGARHEVYPSANAQKAFQLVRDKSPDLVLTDIEMPEGIPSGLQLLKDIKEFNRAIPVIVVTGQSTAEREIEALRSGAYDYIKKPFRVDEVLKRVEHALFQEKAAHALQENAALKQQLRDKFSFDNIVGKSAPMEAVFRMIERVANTDSTVLIVGESGTGKELVAKALHFNSRRAAMPFVPINCGALPEQLLESELFGHRKGAFTGAVFDRNGLFQEADGGTIFLDEVSSMSTALQSKLLRVLQEKEVRRVGDNVSSKVDVRVLAATNEPLEERIKQGKFREDLYYRLNVITIALPPLRERRDDIPLIANAFLRRLGAKNNRQYSITPEAMRLLEAHTWQGNVRELENVLERGAVLSENGVITSENLPVAVLGFSATQPAAATGAEVSLRPAAANFSQQLIPLDIFVADQERAYIQAVINKFGGSKEKAANALGISLATLYRKLKPAPPPPAPAPLH